MLIYALDPELPSLASDAAVELDLLLNGERPDLQAVRQLAQRLQQSLDKPAPDQPARGLQLDTETQTILGQAFTQTGADPATVLNDLLRRTEEVAQQLSSAEAGTDRTDLELQCAFCLALSQAAAAYRQSIFDMKPPHPHRKMM